MTKRVAALAIVIPALACHGTLGCQELTDSDSRSSGQPGNAGEAAIAPIDGEESAVADDGNGDSDAATHPTATNSGGHANVRNAEAINNNAGGLRNVGGSIDQTTNDADTPTETPGDDNRAGRPATDADNAIAGSTAMGVGGRSDGGAMSMGGRNATGSAGAGGTTNVAGRNATGSAGAGGTTNVAGRTATGGTANVGGKKSSSAGATSSGGGQPTSLCTSVVLEHPVTGAQHLATCSPVEFATNPPCEGNHYDDAAAFYTYDVPIPKGFIVHSLEHGGIAVWYNCPKGCPAEVARAQAWIDNLPEDVRCAVDGIPRRVLMVPDPDLATRWAASAWGWTLNAPCFDEAAFSAFYAAHYDKTKEQYCRGTPVEANTCPRGTK